MKLKFSRLLLPFFISLMFFVMWGNSNSKVEAASASTDLYFPNSVLAEGGYNSDGSAKIKDTLVVYVHNNGVGYTLGNNLKVSKIALNIGGEKGITKEFTDNFTSVGNVAIDPISGCKDSLYDCFPNDATNKESKYMGTVTINIKNMIDAVNLPYTNGVNLTIYFQRKGTLFEGLNKWKDYDFPINVYKGGKQGETSKKSASVGYSITDSTYATNNFKITGLALSKSNNSIESLESYNLNDYNSKKQVYLHVQTNYKFKGMIDVCYSVEKCASISFSEENYNGETNKAVANIYDSVINGVVAEKEVVIGGDGAVKLKGSNNTDMYGSKITSVQFSEGISSSVKFYLDNIAPGVLSAGISSDLGNEFYDISEIYPKLNLREDVSYSDLKFGFKIGGEEKEVVLSDDDNNGSSENKVITKTVLLSGSGVILLEKFSVTLTDNYGNTTTYTYSNTKSLCTDNDVITLKSSVQNAESEKNYYYSGDTLNINVTLEGSNVNLNDFEDIYLNGVKGDEVFKYSFTSWSRVDNVATFSYIVEDSDTPIVISNMVFSKKVDNVVSDVANPILNVTFNEYIDFGLDNMTNPDDKSFILYQNNENTGFNVNTMYDSLIVSNSDEILSLKCSLSDGKDIVTCIYTSLKDGQEIITIEEGAIVLENGKKNDEQGFYLVVNERSPIIETELNDSYLYEGNIYYRYGNSLLTLDASDGFGSNSCIYYKINNDEYVNNCVESNESQVIISFPQTDGEYSITYYTSDGVNTSEEITIDEKFIYRGTFNVNNIKITINDSMLDSIDMNEEFNYVNVKYENAKGLDLLKEVKVTTNSGISKTCETETCTIQFSKEELLNIDDNLGVTIELIDQLGNVKVYNSSINVDTILPSFDNINVSIRENEDNHIVTISDYQPYSIGVSVEGVTVTLNNDTFTTSQEMFTMYLTDAAGNINSKLFTTVSPYIELFVLNNGNNDVSYEINISPFDSTIHQIEDYRYLVFDYKSAISNEDMAIAKANVCTTGRKVNCYLSGTYYSDNALIYQTFSRGYTYVLLVKVNNILVNFKDTSELPKLDIVGADTIAPEGSFLDEDINPDYISSTSGMQFKFSFLASDLNLKDTYYYLITKSTLTMNVDKFYDLYTNCYGAVANSNSCGIKGSNKYSSEVEDKYLGEIVVEANNNTRKRLENNVMYSLYVLLIDDANNETVFKVRNFTNISSASTIDYKDDNGVFTRVESGEVSTTGTSEIKVARYGAVDVSSVKVNGEDITCTSAGCNYVLTAGKHDVEVKDVLGNVRNVTIYSAVSSKPIINVEYLYDGVYYKLVDEAYYYNNSNTNNTYVKVSGNGLESITVVMGGISKNYKQGDTLYDEITNASNLHGITLHRLIELHTQTDTYDGIITMSAINEDNMSSNISMTVDNSAPEITIALPGSDINLLGELYTLDVVSGKYQIEYNYKSDITYAYLLEALIIKVDGEDILSMLNVNRLKIRVDNALIDDVYNLITMGDKVITIDYFDRAGNIASTLTINVSVIDDELPVVVLRNIKETVELNTEVNLADVIATDNHDYELTIVAKVNNEEINYKAYKFTDVGEFTIIYYVKDSSNNETSITQKVLVMDTVAPLLKEGTLTSYVVGVENVLEFDMPKFVDGDNSEYSPYQIKVLDILGNEMDSGLASYPLSYDSNKIRIRFNTGYTLGNYTIVFITKDKANNTSVTEFNITLQDLSAPSISIYINDNEAANDSVNIFPFNSDIVIEARADDSYDGNLTQSVTKTITFNGNEVGAIDTSKSGDYEITFTVVDTNGNTTVVSTTIRIAIDKILPVIESVTFNGMVMNENSVNKLNALSFIVNVEASDDSNQIETEIVYKDNNNAFMLNNNSLISLESGLIGYLFSIEIKVKDSSGNSVVKVYEFVVDNVKPNVGGIVSNNIYNTQLNINIYDENIKTIEIIKNGNQIGFFEENIYNYKVSENGTYTIIVMDTYDNKEEISFVVANDKKYTIIGDDNNTYEKTFDKSLLIEVEIDELGMNFILDKGLNVNKDDQIYILINHPSSGHKYIIHSMNGQAYNANSLINIEGQVIEGVSNTSLLEKIGDKYYAYVMVVSSQEVDNKNDDKNDSILGSIVMAILGILLVIAAVIIIMKIRRRVRAV